MSQVSTAEAFRTAHAKTLDAALAAICDRGHWTPYPEHAKAYGEDGSLSAADGRAAFDALLGQRFELDQPTTGDWVGTERSPFGLDLGVSYPRVDVDALLAAAAAAVPAWRDAGPETRAAVCLEILHRINQRSHEFAHAVSHTTGQAYGMAFQAGGPHAQDRGLEAIAYAYAEMTRHPATVEWEKPQGKRPPLRMAKRFTVVGRGIALVVGCNTFPTWNGYPGLFASLVTGNPVVVKPHPGAVLPLALTVRIAREVLAEAGFSPDLVTLAAENHGGELARTLALRPEVRIIDYTGSTAFGDWLEANARQAVVFTEKAGVNTVVVDSTDDYRGLLSNLAFSFSLYSGQMCTTPQNVLVPRDGITVTGPDGTRRRTFEEFATDLAAAVTGLLSDEARATAILGATVNDGVRQRVAAADSLGRLVLASRQLVHPEFPAADVRTPALVALDAAVDSEVYTREHFGPIALLVATDSTDHSLQLLRSTVREHGAMTAAVYATDDKTVAAAEEVAWETGVALSVNLTQGVYVNQSSAFSDFHGTGANPAANAALTDGAFVAGRFRVVQSRRHLVGEG